MGIWFVICQPAVFYWNYILKCIYMNFVTRRLRLMSLYSIFIDYLPYFAKKNLFKRAFCHISYIHFPFFLSFFEAVTLNEWKIQYSKGIVNCEKNLCLLNQRCIKTRLCIKYFFIKSVNLVTFTEIILSRRAHFLRHFFFKIVIVLF